MKPFTRKILEFLLAACAVISLSEASANAQIIGPAFPPPLNVNFLPSGSGIGFDGGELFSFSGCALADSAKVYWGVTPSGVSDNYGTMTFSSITGNTLLYGNGTSRCRVVVGGAALVSAASVGISDANGTIGYVVQIPASATSWTVNIYMEGQSGGVWYPDDKAYDLNQQLNHLNSPTNNFHTSFTGGFYYANITPLIGSIRNLSVAAGTTVAPVPFTIYPPGSVFVGASSDNQTVLPDNQIVTSGSGTNRTVTPQTTSASGVANVMVTFANFTNGVQTQQSFTVTNFVTPFLSGFTNLVIQENSSSQPIPFTIGDSILSPDLLMITTLSTDTNLVPLANLVLSGSGSNRSLTITPAPDKYGTNVIGVRISNGLLTNAGSFKLTVNSPPRLIVNNGLTLNQHGLAPITITNLMATDADSTNTSQVIFTIPPGGMGGPPHYGTLYKSGTPLGGGDTFTEGDIENRLIWYQHDGSCNTQDDFQFGISDSNGGIASDHGFMVFTFPIAIIPVPVAPVPVNSTNYVPLGGTVSGAMLALNADCVNTSVSFFLASQPKKGTVTFDGDSGTYIYTPTNSQPGTDFFKFLVSNGLFSTNLGTNFFVIQNTQPTVQATNFTLLRANLFTNTLHATDPDRPTQVLTYTITSNGSKGTVTLLNATNGTFVYILAPRRFGPDSFTVTVSDGLTNSAPVTIGVMIVPQAAYYGDLVVSEDSSAAILLFNPENGDTGTISSGGLLNGPAFLVTEPAGTILVADSTSGLLRIDPRTGAQTLLVSSNILSQATGVALEPGGTILVSDIGKQQISRFSHYGLLLTNFPQGNMTVPAGLVVRSDGMVFVANPGPFFDPTFTNAIFSVDSGTLVSQALSMNGLLNLPISLALEPSGTFLVGQPMDNTIIRVDPTTGLQSQLGVTNSYLNMAFGLAVDAAGKIYAVNSGDGAVIGIDPDSGSQIVLAPPGTLGFPFGAAIAGVPLLPPVLTGISVTGPSTYQVILDGFPGAIYTVLSSTNLLTPLDAWQEVGVATETNLGKFYVIDAASSNAPVRFYRARAN